MPYKDLTRWKLNKDGSWARKLEIPNVEFNATTGAAEAAAEYGVDLATVTGTGKDGKITKADVEATLK